MSQISVENLTFCYDGSYTDVFKDICFRIDTDWNLGLVGRNGRGKTTLLNLLLGKYEYRGKISSDRRFVYFPFAVTDKSRLAADIAEEICMGAQEWEIVRELSALGMDPQLLYRPFDTLSSGEQTKLLLVGMFLNEGGFPLIDEPTNHLDMQARKTVAEYLSRKKGFILVSHDRAFLDGCVDHIMSINRSSIQIRNGNFSSYLEEFERRQAFETACNERLEKDIASLKESAARTERWAERTESEKHGKTSAGLKPDRGYVGHKSAKMMKRAKATAARSVRAVERKAELLHDVETSEPLKMFPLVHRSQRLLSLSQTKLFYDGKKACGPLSFEIERGERVALHGKNGSGKSSLLKMIVGLPMESKGVFSAASGLIVSYVPQTTDALKGRISELARNGGVDLSLLIAVLDKMGMEKKDFDRDMSDLSQGQKKKILIAESLCEKAHLYVWDEPLNYVDVYSRLQVEELIKAFEPTMIFVEHDKAFQDAIATRVIELKSPPSEK